MPSTIPPHKEKKKKIPSDEGCKLERGGRQRHCRLVLQPGRADARLALSAGGCPSPSSSLFRAAHVWSPLHIQIWKTPATVPLQVSVAPGDLCLCNCLGVVRDYCCLSPSQGHLLPLVPAESSPCLCIQAQPEISSAQAQALQVLEATPETQGPSPCPPVSSP